MRKHLGLLSADTEVLVLGAQYLWVRQFRNSQKLRLGSAMKVLMRGVNCNVHLSSYILWISVWN